MVKRFIATHKQTGEVRYGYFSELCDLDKRVWNLREWTEQYYSEPKPMAVITVWTRPHRFSVEQVEKQIWSHQDLVGIYLGDAGLS